MMMWSSACDMMVVTTMCYITLQVTLVSKMGRQFSGRQHSPFFEDRGYECSLPMSRHNVFDTNVDAKDVESRFVKLKPKKAVGPASISARILKSCTSQLCDVFNVLFPWSLKHCRVPNLSSQLQCQPRAHSMDHQLSCKSNSSCPFSTCSFVCKSYFHWFSPRHCSFSCSLHTLR